MALTPEQIDHIVTLFGPCLLQERVDQLDGEQKELKEVTIPMLAADLEVAQKVRNATPSAFKDPAKAHAVNKLGREIQIAESRVAELDTELKIAQTPAQIQKLLLENLDIATDDERRVTYIKEQEAARINAQIAKKEKELEDLKTLRDAPVDP